MNAPRLIRHLTMAAAAVFALALLWWICTPARPAAPSFLTGHSAPILSISFSENGRWLATGGLDGALRFWDVGRQRVTATFEGHDAGVGFVAFLKGDGVVVSASIDGELRTWSFPDGRRLAEASVFTDGRLNARRYSYALDATRSHLATGEDSGDIHLWKVDQAGVARITRIGHEAADVAVLRFSPAGDLVASGSSTGDIALWSAKPAPWFGALFSGTAPIRRWHAHTGAVASLAFSGPDTLISAGGGGEVRVWNWRVPRLLNTLGNGTARYAVADVSDDLDRVIGGTSSGILSLWSRRSGARLGSRELQGPISAVAVSDTAHVAALADSERVFFAKLDSAMVVPGAAQLVDEQRLLIPSPDSLHLLTGNRSRLYVWQTSTMELLHSIARDRTLGGEFLDLSSAFWANAEEIAIPAEVTRRSPGEEGALSRVDPATRAHTSLHTGLRRIAALAYAPDAQRVFIATSDGALYEISLATGARRAILRHSEAPLGELKPNPTQPLLASRTDGGEIQVWNTNSGRRILELLGHDEVAWSPNGRFLAASGDDLEVWDSETGRTVLRVSGANYTEKQHGEGNYIGLTVAWAADSSHVYVGVRTTATLNNLRSLHRLELWNIYGRSPLWSRELEGSPGIAHLGLTGSGALVAVTTDDLVAFVRPSDGVLLRKFRLPAGDTGHSRAIAIDRDTLVRLARLGGEKRRVEVWTLSDPAELIWSHEVDDAASLEPVSRAAVLISREDGVHLVADPHSSSEGLFLGRLAAIAPSSRELLATAVEPEPHSKLKDIDLVLFNVKRGSIASRRLSGVDSSGGSIHASSDGSAIWQSAKDGRLSVWEVATGLRRGDSSATFDQHGVPVLAGPHARHVVTRSTFYGEGKLSLRDSATGGTAWTTTDDHHGNLAGVVWLDRERQLVTATYGDFSRSSSTQFGHDAFSAPALPGMFGPVEYSIKVWDLDTGRLLRTIGVKRKLFGGRQAIVADSGGVLAVDASDQASVIASGGRDRRIRLWNTADGHLAREFAHQDSTIVATALSGAASRVYSASSTGRIAVFQSSGQLLATSAAFQDGEWITYTPEGWFVGSPEGQSYIQWTIGQRIATAAQLGPLFENRQQVERRLAGESVSVPRPRLAPDLRLLQMETDNERRITAIDVSAENGDRLFGLNVFVNGRKVPPPAGGWQQSPEQPGAVRVSAGLRPGANQVALQAFSQDGITGQLLTVSASVPGPAPRLWVLAFASNWHPDPSLRLLSAEKDAIEFAHVLSRQRGRLYSEVEVTTLTGSEAQPSSLISALRGIAQRALQSDLVVIYLASHGFRRPGGLALVGGLGSEIAWRDVDGELAAIKARAIVFLDACHASSFAGVASTEDFLDALPSANAAGAIVFASSKARQSSFETAGGGFFTSAVLTAIQGGADLAPRDGLVSFDELVAYVTEAVDQRSGSHQQPFVSRRDMVADFPFAASLPVGATSRRGAEAK